MSRSAESFTTLGIAAMARLNRTWRLVVLASCVLGIFVIRRVITHQTSKALPATSAKSVATIALPSKTPTPMADPAPQTPPQQPRQSHSPVVDQDIAVHITGLKLQESKVYVAMFESEKGFPNGLDSAQTTILQSAGTHLELAMPRLAGQPRAIAVFQDLDGNGQLSKNAIGIPTEPYGFSNNVRGLWGPPQFKEAVIRLDDVTGPVESRIQ
ncbi:MAG: DUF2141 domain-containing protein [Planctomycetota bacterium]|nr:MAG: DUF2141 domain-containing protein [Planctomycetota bacterium]